MRMKVVLVCLRLSLILFLTNDFVRANQLTMDADTLLIPMTTKTPDIDGDLDDVWKNVTNTRMIAYAPGYQTDGWTDLYSSFRVLWDTNNLYIFVTVIDDIISTNAANLWDKDCIEIYFDGDNSKNDQATGYDSNDVQWRYVYGESSGGNNHTNLAFRQTAFGYNFELAIPMNNFPVDLTDGHVFGCDIQTSDNDYGTLESVVKWWSENLNAWQDASLFGYARLTNRVVSDEMDVPFTLVQPAIDGAMDGIWLSAPEMTFNTYVEDFGLDLAAMSRWDDLQMSYRTMWDENNIYLYVSVIDQSVQTPSSNEWENDGIEIYFDGDNSKNDENTGYDENDLHWTYVYGCDEGEPGAEHAEHAWQKTELGYDLEIRIPADDLSFDLTANHAYGFEVQINDNDGNNRDDIAKWWSSSDNTWLDPSLFGTAKLIGQSGALAVYLTSPAPNSTVIAGDDLVISAEVVIDKGSVSKVEFLNENDKIGEDTQAPFGMVLNNVTEGIYKLSARVTTSTGKIARSSVITINVVPDSNLDRSEPPIFSVDHGFYQTSFELEISATTLPSTIKYSLDGSDPRFSETAVSGSAPVTVMIDPESSNKRPKTPAVIVRACVFQAGLAASDVVTNTYVFFDDVKTQQFPGGGWPTDNVNGQNFDWEMDANVVNDSRYSSLIDDALLDIPTISLVTDLDSLFDPQVGIYVNAEMHGMDWERMTSVELINPDGSEGFQINAGLRIRGGWSRHDYFPKHAFRLFFRNKYGAGKLKYPMFGDEGADEFDKLDLRTSQNYSWSAKDYEGHYNTMNKDVFSRDLQRDMGQPYTRSRYYHLYLNGMYWGLFQSQERAEASFAATYLGGDKNDYDVVKVDIGENWDRYEIEATDGNTDAWEEVWDALLYGFDGNDSYFQLQGMNPDATLNATYTNLVDIDNLIDYMLVIFYTGNFDAPCSKFMQNKNPNNFYCIYNRERKNGFIFLTQDSEHTLLVDGVSPGIGLFENRVNIGDLDDYYRMEVWGFPNFHPQWLHYYLLANEEYRMKFADHIDRHFFNNGEMTPAKSIERFMSRANEIQLAIIAESARWGDAQWEPARTKDDDWLPTVNSIVSTFFPARTAIVLDQLRDEGLYPTIDAPIFKQGSTQVKDEKIEISTNYNLTITNPNNHGSIYYTTDDSDPRLIGGSISSSAKNGANQADIAIGATTVVSARIKNGSTWSAIHKLTFVKPVDLGNLKITELHYHPLDEGTVNDGEYEFVELKNIGNTTLDLSQVAFTNGIDYTFPLGTNLPAGQFIVLASNKAEFDHRYGFMPFDEYIGQFDNGGERVVVQGATGDTLISFRYNDKSPWPVEPDGAGNSLVTKDLNPTGEPNDPSVWQASAQIHGSPSEDEKAVGIEMNLEHIPMSYALFQNCPNPFNLNTSIGFQLPHAGDVRLTVYNTAGQLVRILQHGVLPAGAYDIHWDSCDAAGNVVSSGVYLYRLQAGDEIRTRRMLLMK
ncbi:CotH kinase family protein [candidate division KSB1 bacterium]|nr:CotH kinase family protein [candidate division KSB1 bacterium]